MGPPGRETGLGPERAVAHSGCLGLRLAWLRQWTEGHLSLGLHDAGAGEACAQECGGGVERHAQHEATCC